MPGPLRKRTIGKLRQRVTIQAATETGDDFNQAVQDWQDEATVWAAVEPFPAPGRETFQAGQVQASATHYVVMRWRDGLTPKKRLVWQVSATRTVILNIVAVLPSEGGANYLDVWCLRPESPPAE